MNKLTLTLTSIAVLALGACSTTSALKSPDSLLLASIPAEKIGVDVGTVTKLATSDPICVEFYQNAGKFAELALAEAPGLPGAPDVPGLGGGGFGMELLKTLALGTVAGAASGGIGSLGISSSFLELALAGAANQVVFQGANTALDVVTAGKDDKAEAVSEAGEAEAASEAGEAAAPVELSPIQYIEAAAEKIGCLAPDAESLGLDVLENVTGAAGGVTAGDHTHSASEHSHTSSDGTTYTHTH